MHLARTDNSGLFVNAAGDLFEADGPSGNIYEFTPGGVQSTYASGFSGHAQGVTFDSAGNLFVTTWFDASGGSIYKVTPNGQMSTFATGLDFPEGLAFQPVPEPSVWAMLAMGSLALFGLRRRACRR